jgi:branched-chain amino acid transport system substrate-binding protein
VLLAVALGAAGLAIAAIRSRGPGATSSAVAPPSAPSGCRTNRGCNQAGGEPSLCRPDTGACVPLASEDCRVLFEPGDAEADDAVWFGAMFPLEGDDAAVFGKSNLQAIDLARRDFRQMMRGYHAGAAVRRLGVLACDDTVSPERAAHHLVDEVRVPAVIGFRASDEAIELSTSTFVPNRVLTIVALNTSPLIAKIPQPTGEPRLVWRTTYSTATTALALSALVSGVFEPRMRSAPRAVSPSRPLRVALVRAATVAGQGLSHELFLTLRFNGKSALENEADFREFTMDEAKGGTGTHRNYAELVADLARMEPHVVIYNGHGWVMTNIIEPLEAAWPRELPYRPFYASGTGFGVDEVPVVVKHAGLRQRMFATSSVSSTVANARFVLHYNETYPDKITRAVAPNTSYDAFYLLAYATYALGDERVSGPALARSIRRLLPPGPILDVGPEGIFDAFDALRVGKNIDLNGATSKLDFDPETGDAPTDHAILCVAQDPRAHTFDVVESGLVYDASERRLSGKLRCP